MQNSYCISDSNVALEVRARVRDSLLPLYKVLISKIRDVDRQVKYNEDSLSIVIGRLFDNPS